MAGAIFGLRFSKDQCLRGFAAQTWRDVAHGGRRPTGASDTEAGRLASDTKPRTGPLPAGEGGRVHGGRGTGGAERARWRKLQKGALHGIGRGSPNREGFTELGGVHRIDGITVPPESRSGE